MATQRIRAKPVDNKPSHYAFNFTDPEDEDYAEDDTEPAPKSDNAEKTEVDAEPGQYLLAQTTVDALGVEFLDEINNAFEKDSQANPLWVLVQGMQKLEPEQNANSKPAMSGPSEYSNYGMNDSALAALGERFLMVLETFIRLNPQKDPRKAVNGAVEYIPSVKNMKSGRP